MGNNHSTNIDAEPEHTERFLEIVRLRAETDFRVENGEEIPNRETRRMKWEEFVMHCYYLAANLRCQWFSRHAVTLYNNENDEAYWDAVPIQHVREGVHAMVLLYAAKGVCLDKLLSLPHIRDELERRGMPGNVIWSIVVTGRSNREPICHLNDWLLDELNLRNDLAPGIATLTNRVRICRKMTTLVDSEVDKYYRNEGLSLPVLKRAVNAAACQMFPERFATARGYFLDLVDSPEVADLFYRHYRILSGGRDYKSETEEDERSLYKHCRFSGVVAAVFCSMTLSTGVSVEALAADPRFSDSGDDGSDDGSGWNPAPGRRPLDNNRRDTAEDE